MDKDIFIQTGKDIEKNIRDICSKYNGRITTITCFSSLNANINIVSLINAYNDNCSEWKQLCSQITQYDILMRIHGTSKGVRPTKHKKHISFYNAISLLYIIGKRKICCKIFRNGFHITGCCSFDMYIEASNIMRYIVSHIIHNKNLHITTYSIQLMNILIVLNHELEIDNIVKAFHDNKIKIDGHSLSFFYDIERYSGLRVKINDIRCTILLFPSGKVMYTGLKQTQHIIIIHNVLEAILQIK